MLNTRADSLIPTASVADVEEIILKLLSSRALHEIN
jgi:hypothetical protein